MLSAARRVRHFRVLRDAGGAVRLGSLGPLPSVHALLARLKEDGAGGEHIGLPLGGCIPPADLYC